jgi:hypothetical protein
MKTQLPREHHPSFFSRPSWTTAAVLTAGAASCLLLAFVLPLVHVRFSMEFPTWLPNFGNIHGKLQGWIIDQGKIPVGDRYLLGIVIKLFQAHEFFLATAIALFSLGFPVLKIGACVAGLLVGPRMAYGAGGQILLFVSLAGKWSMADVFIIAFMIVFFRADGFHLEFQGRAGLYCFAISALLSSFAVARVKHCLLVTKEFEVSCRRAQ